ncbi:MAG: hypothetical protein WA001_04165 [Patescibacteria group bacterium]
MKKLWFRSKRYGYGWYPITWQGWLVILVYLVVALGNAWYFTTYTDQNQTLPWFLLTILVSTAILLWICARTGEPLKWRWGNKK